MHSLDYNTRPAKHAERVMLVKAMSKLQAFRSLESYRYIGFGATFFKDFKIIHKELGISDMICIEIDSMNRERFDNNVPYKCIKMVYGSSTSELPKLQWDIPTIIWLDYIGKISKDSLADITLIASKALTGSMIIVTLNAENAATDDDIEIADTDRTNHLKKLELRVGESNVPLGTTNKDLVKWGTAEVYRKIIFNKIQDSLVSRNGVKTDPNKMIYEQLFYYEYADGAKMVTIGGVFYEKGQEHLKANCMFQSLPFIRNSSDPYHIEIPILTTREIQYLEANMPEQNIETIPRKGIPKEEIQKYSAIYKEFPNFAAIEM